MGNKKQISFEITNTSDKVKEFHLFGYSKHLHSLNFGNDTNLRIKPDFNSYLQVLVESAFSPSKIELIRLCSVNKGNIVQVVKFINEDGYGCIMTHPLDFGITNTQMQLDITDLKVGLRLDHNATLNFKIQPNSSMRIYLWVEELERVDYIQSHNPTLSQIAKLFFKKLFKLK